MTTTVAWLLTEEGVVALIGARRLFWPGSAEVTFADGTTKVVNALNVLSKDSLDVRFDFRQHQHQKETIA